MTQKARDSNAPSLSTSERHADRLVEVRASYSFIIITIVKQTTECVLPLTHIDLFRSLTTALTLIKTKTMQPHRANVICVRLHTRKLTRRLRTVGLPDNDKGASPDLRVNNSLHVSLCVRNATREKVCVSKPTCPKHTYAYRVHMLQGHTTPCLLLE